MFRRQIIHLRISDIVVLFVGVSLLLLSFVFNDRVSLKILEIDLFIIYFYSLFLALNRYGIASIETLFLITLGLFSFVRVFLTIFNLDDFLEGVIGIFNFQWKTGVAVKVLGYYIIFLLVYLITSLNRKKDDNQKWVKNEGSEITNDRLLFYIKWAMILSAPITIFYYVSFALRVVSIGYSSIYTGEVTYQGGINTLFSVFSYIFNISYYTLCLKENNKNQFIKYSILFLIVHYITLIQGSRADLISSTLFFLFFLNSKYNVKIKAFWYILGILIFIPLMGVVIFIRSGINIQGVGFGKIIQTFFKTTSNSINIFGYYLLNKDNLPKFSTPYVLEPIIRLYLMIRYGNIMGAQSEDLIRIRPSLNHQLSYYVSHSRYLSGYAVGSNFLAELAQGGIIEVILGSILVCFLISYFSSHLKKSRYLQFMSYEFFAHIIIMPRAELFYDTYSLLKYFLFFAVIMVIDTNGKIIFKHRARITNVSKA